MPEKQRRITNILLFFILLFLLAQLAVDLAPYVITGRIFNSISFSTSNSSTSDVSFSTQESQASWENLFFGDTPSP
ncbi:hypothetical protein JR338_10515 [Chloroflexota bacterium]|nr:hypothetical protein JR338_10515 [Chloroflexota bacterium]